MIRRFLVQVADKAEFAANDSIETNISYSCDVLEIEEFNPANEQFDSDRFISSVDHDSIGSAFENAMLTALFEGIKG